MEETSETREYGKLYPAARAVLSPIFKTLWRVRVQGLEHVPDYGGAIFCPNHTSVIDSFFLPVVLPRRISFVGKAEYMDSWKTKHIFPALGMIPIDRSGGSAAERALNTAAAVLERGEFFGIYPEGTRARDGRLRRGHTGPARLALRTQVPIVPVGIVGTREIQPPDAKLPKPFKTAEVRFGRPIDVRRYSDRTDDRMVLRQIIDEVMYEIRQLSGQEYVDEYATKSAETFPTAATTHIASLGDPGPNGHVEGDGANGHGEAAEGGDGSEQQSSADALSKWS
ncbi:MAG: lysophospholipid acyltransferase family protein [Acidimicrobiales bacterium]|nr:lysophospholipid acyltransferase family protein [Acidimicrobiales bacterium]